MSERRCGQYLTKMQRETENRRDRISLGVKSTAPAKKRRVQEDRASECNWLELVLSC